MKTKIVHEDRDILVCHKPAGLAVESAAIGRMDMVSELKNYLKSPYLGVVHRLDQPVEGLLVFAKNPKAAASLSKQLQQSILNKEYYAVVCGKPNLDEGRLVDYLQKDNKTRTAKVVRKGAPDAKEAILTYQVLNTISIPANGMEAEVMKSEPAAPETQISLLCVKIKTGRFHQIRAQLSRAGTPILGDQKYGHEASLELSKKAGAVNVALCACGLELKHPVNGQKMSFEIVPNTGAFALFEIK